MLRDATVLGGTGGTGAFVVERLCRVLQVAHSILACSNNPTITILRSTPSPAKTG